MDKLDDFLKTLALTQQRIYCLYSILIVLTGILKGRYNIINLHKLRNVLRETGLPEITAYTLEQFDTQAELMQQRIHVELKKIAPNNECMVQKGSQSFVTTEEINKELQQMGLDQGIASELILCASPELSVSACRAVSRWRKSLDTLLVIVDGAKCLKEVELIALKRALKVLGIRVPFAIVNRKQLYKYLDGLNCLVQYKLSQQTLRHVA